MLFLEDLENLTLRLPDAHGQKSFLRCRSHQSSPLYAYYEASSGMLTLICSHCRSVVAQVAVAQRDDHDGGDPPFGFKPYS
jgi:hypothetical protein